MQSKDTYTIGEAAKMIGSTVKTIRYYDEIELLKPSRHTEGGHRLYTAKDLWRLELITTLRYLNFSIQDIRKLISGETGIAEALDLQIEALEVQVGTLNSMISILRQAKQYESESASDAGQSLRYITGLVDSLSANVEKRKQFVSAKMEESRILEGIPQEWRVSFFHFFEKYIMKENKLSARQTLAWNELQGLISDPGYLADLARCELPFFSMVHHPQVRAEDWVRKMEEIRIRTTAALDQQWPASSPAVQTIVQDFVMMYASSEQVGDGEAFFRKQARYMLNSVTERILRFNKLCTILNPESSVIVDGVGLLMEGMRHRLEQLNQTQTELL